MSIPYSYNNNSNYYNLQNTSNTKTQAIADVQHQNTQKFDFNKLNDGFAKDGLEFLQKELEFLKQNNVIKDFSMAIDVSSNKQIISIDLDGITYSFMGAVGEFVA